MFRRLTIRMLAVVVLVGTGCAQTLYERLGRRPAISAVVDDLIG